MKRFNLIFLLFILIGINACTNSEKESRLQQSEVLSELSTTIILPLYKENLTYLKKLDTAMSDLIEIGGKEQVDKARMAYKNSVLSWKKAEIYNFGPVKNQFLFNSINYWPTDTTMVRKSIATHNGSEEFLQQVGSNAKGFSALEYLLFEYDSLLTNKQAESYASLVVRDLISKFESIVNSWETDYITTFNKAEGTQVNSALSMVINSWIYSIETIKSKKIEEPAGLDEGTAQPSKLESPYAKLSLSMIESNIESLKLSFNGKNEKGIKDYLQQLDIKQEGGSYLHDKINAKFDEITSLLQKIKSMETAIQQESESLNQLYLALLDLSILYKNDLSSQLNIVTTFSDTDGD